MLGVTIRNASVYVFVWGSVRVFFVVAAVWCFWVFCWGGGGGGGGGGGYFWKRPLETLAKPRMIHLGLFLFSFCVNH